MSSITAAHDQPWARAQVWHPSTLTPSLASSVSLLGLRPLTAMAGAGGLPAVGAQARSAWSDLEGSPRHLACDTDEQVVS